MPKIVLFFKGGDPIPVPAVDPTSGYGLRSKNTQAQHFIMPQNQCFGSESGWIRIQIARLDPDPYSESGIGSCIRNPDPDPESVIEL